MQSSMKQAVLVVFLSGIVLALAQTQIQACIDTGSPQLACNGKGAPADANSRCKEGAFSQYHVLPQNWNVLLDSYNYLVLNAGPFITFNSWETFDANNNGRGDFLSWLPSYGSTCTRGLYTCTFSAKDQNNWLFSQFICLGDAKELFLNVTYRFTQCRDDSRCDNDYITAHRYDVDVPATKVEQKKIDNYKPLNGTLENSRWQQPPSRRINNVMRTFQMLRPEPRMNGFHLGLQDTGTCGEVTRIILYYTICSGRQQELVVYPEFANPPRDGPNEIYKARCVCNAHNTTSLDVIAYSSTGTCVDSAPGGARCECNDGYQIDDTSRSSCIPCPSGEYKAVGVDSTCRACPENTSTDAAAARQCKCSSGFFRDDNPSHPEGPEVACTAPPKPVTDMKLVVNSDTTVTIEWNCPPDTGRTDTYYIVCYSNFADSNCGAPYFATSCVSTYTITGLTPNSMYVANVSARNGVSDQDSENDDRRVASLVVSTTEGVPNQPFLKRLCTVVIWKPPTSPKGVIRSYELCFGKCDVQFQCYNLSADDNFFLTSDGEREGDVDVQIRASNSLYTGAWTECQTIGCEDFRKCPISSPPPPTTPPPPPSTTTPPPPPTTLPPPPPTTLPPPPPTTLPPPPPTTLPPTTLPPPPTTLPPPPPTTLPPTTLPPPPPTTPPPPPTTHPSTTLPNTTCEGIYFTLKGVNISRGGEVSISNIGTNNDALMCHTVHEDCCKNPVGKGEWYTPSGNRVGLRRDIGPIYRNRGVQFIRLNHRVTGGVVVPGIYECHLPNSCNVDEHVPIRLV